MHELKEGNNNIQYILSRLHTLFSMIREKPVIKAFHCMHRPGLVTTIINLFSDSVTHILAVLQPEMVHQLLVLVLDTNL